jgi:hypothetical protein
VQEARPRRRLRRILGFTALGLFALVSLALAGATAILQGERLGRIISGALPELAGKLQLGGLTWQARLYRDLLTDAPTPLVVEGLVITDPDGTVVLRAARLEVKVPAALGHRREESTCTISSWARDRSGGSPR